MLPQGTCHNGCCRSQPCLNGGTCVEHCQSPKKKFACQCVNGYGGTVCEKPTSCMTVSKRSRAFPSNGVYWIIQDSGVLIPVYCAFEQNPTRAWTLIESFTFAKKEDFKYKAFYLDYEINLNNPPSWNRYRIGLSKMQHVRSSSTLFRATCDFPNRNGVLTPDLLIGRLSDVDILTYHFQSQQTCRKFMFVDIRGHSCTNCMVYTLQNYYSQNRHFYIDVTHGYCEFKPPYSVKSVDSFGCYETTDTISKCTATPQSTTQWWLGEEK